MVGTLAMPHTQVYEGGTIVVVGILPGGTEGYGLMRQALELQEGREVG